MNIADIFILCICAPVAIFCLCVAVFLAFVFVCLVIGIGAAFRERWNGYWGHRITDIDEGDQWKK